MKCQNCGRELRNGARFCIGCGAQHDENGQLVGGNKGHIDYNKTMMASDMPQPNAGGIDYNKTMMVGNTGFQQYQPEQNQQSYQQYNEGDYGYNNEPASNKNANKKKLSPIMIICPVIIIAALAFSLLNGKKSKTTIEVEKEPEIVATVSEVKQEDDRPKIHLKGYWSADADYFYIDGEMQKNIWVEDYYVGEDGKKVTNEWIDNKYYVDSTGKMARNEWIEFQFYGDDGHKKIGFYYVGNDGKKVYDETIDGRYINAEGCYWPKEGDNIQNEEKKTKESINDKEESSKAETQKVETVKPTEVVKQTTTTTVPTTVYQTVVPETQATIVAPTEKSVSAVASDGKTISYQKTTETFPDENITKYVSVIVDDPKYPNLTVGINDWNSNRDRSGIASGETMLNETITITYDVNVERNDNKIFSLYETETKLDNKKAYEKKKRGYTWDSVSGQQLTLDAIFNGEDKYSDFANKAFNKIKSSKSSFDEETYEEVIEDDPESLLTGCEWYMTNTGIVLVFSNEFTGSEKVEPLTITLTYAESGNNINKLLLTKYRKS